MFWNFWSKICCLEWCLSGQYSAEEGSNFHFPGCRTWTPVCAPDLCSSSQSSVSQFQALLLMFPVANSHLGRGVKQDLVYLHSAEEQSLASAFAMSPGCCRQRKITVPLCNTLQLPCNSGQHSPARVTASPPQVLQVILPPNTNASSLKIPCAGAV